MKNAIQWWGAVNPENYDHTLELIKAIQRDALLHAAQICQNGYASNVSMTGLMDLNDAAKAIEAEADKLR